MIDVTILATPEEPEDEEDKSSESNDKPKKKETRPSSAKRGYGHDWRKFRLEFLAKNPVCCREGCRNPATEVDHEPELTGPDDPGRLDPKRCAPLCKSCHSSKTASQTHADNYEVYLERQAERSRMRSLIGRDIGELPEVVNPERKERGRKSLEAFAMDYFPHRFYLAFSQPHRDAITRFEHISANGGKFALAMPRGSGKTSLAEVDIIRDAVYGFRKFQVMMSATDGLANESLEKIKAEFETNDLLLEDFPEVCYPIRRLERITNRTKGQLFDGEPTYINWTDGITLPTIPGSPASGSTIRTVGITGAIRGLSVFINGTPVRPDKVIFDDCQTRESAESPTQTAKRESIIKGDALGLAGPTVEISAAMLCTVIRKNDLSSRFLSHELNPQWRGQKTKMLDKFPGNMERWDEYAEMRRRTFIEAAGDMNLVNKACADFYTRYREELEKGAVVTWAERKKPGELTGLQSAMNLYYEDSRMMLAEYNNDPADETTSSESKRLEALEVSSRCNGYERYMVPGDCTRVTAMIDVHKRLLYYAIVAFNETFGGAVIDYGTWPRQNRSIFALSDARPSLVERFPGYDDEQLVFAGLNELTSVILGRSYPRIGGGEHRISKCLIDSGWKSKAVYEFIRQSPFDPIIFPSKGVARSDTSVGVARWQLRPGEKKGFHWRQTTGEHGKKQQIQFDPDAWKSLLYGKLSNPLGSKSALKSALAFWGTDPHAHELIAQHCAAEQSELKMTKGDRYDKWTVVFNEPDNHWFDCLNGSCVAASVDGLVWHASGSAVQPAATVQEIDIGELRRQMIEEERRRR